MACAKGFWVILGQVPAPWVQGVGRAFAPQKRNSKLVKPRVSQAC